MDTVKSIVNHSRPRKHLPVNGEDLPSPPNLKSRKKQASVMTGQGTHFSSSRFKRNSRKDSGAYMADTSSDASAPGLKQEKGIGSEGLTSSLGRDTGVRNEKGPAAAAASFALGVPDKSKARQGGTATTKPHQGDASLGSTAESIYKDQKAAEAPRKKEKVRLADQSRELGRERGTAGVGEEGFPAESPYETPDNEWDDGEREEEYVESWERPENEAVEEDIPVTKSFVKRVRSQRDPATGAYTETTETTTRSERKPLMIPPIVPSMPLSGMDETGLSTTEEEQEGEEGGRGMEPQSHAQKSGTNGVGDVWPSEKTEARGPALMPVFGTPISSNAWPTEGKGASGRAPPHTTVIGDGGPGQKGDTQSPSAGPGPGTTVIGKGGPDRSMESEKGASAPRGAVMGNLWNSNEGKARTNGPTTSTAAGQGPRSAESKGMDTSGPGKTTAQPSKASPTQDRSMNVLGTACPVGTTAAPTMHGGAKAAGPASTERSTAAAAAGVPAKASSGSRVAEKAKSAITSSKEKGKERLPATTRKREPPRATGPMGQEPAGPQVTPSAGPSVFANTAAQRGLEPVPEKVKGPPDVGYGFFERRKLGKHDKAQNKLKAKEDTLRQEQLLVEEKRATRQRKADRKHEDKVKKQERKQQKKLEKGQNGIFDKIFGSSKKKNTAQNTTTTSQNASQNAGQNARQYAGQSAGQNTGQNTGQNVGQNVGQKAGQYASQQGQNMGGTTLGGANQARGAAAKAGEQVAGRA